MKKVKLSEIATHCGLSITAVSSILNSVKGYKVPESTRKLVFDTARKLNYRPNLNARSLITRKHYTVGLLFYSVQDRCHSELMAAIQIDLASRQYASLFSFWKDSSLESAVNFLTARGIDGIITIAPEEETKELRLEFPVVYYGPRPPVTGDGIVVERAVALRKLLEDMLKCGVRLFGYLGNHFNEPRYDELLGFIADNGLEANPDWLVATGNSFAEREAGLARLLKSASLPEVLICQNDITAMLAIQMVTTAGYRVPDDLSIVGFDNLQESRFTCPPLSTMDIAIERTAHELVATLFERIEHPEQPQIIKSIEPLYISRNSTKQRRIE